MFPTKFFNANIFYQIQENLEFKETTPLIPLEIIYWQQPTATNFDPEHKLWYFREDIGVNSHHFNWHCVYTRTKSDPDGDGIVAKDRRGELFYYMHEQVSCELLI